MKWRGTFEGKGLKVNCVRTRIILVEATLGKIGCLKVELTCV